MDNQFVDAATQTRVMSEQAAKPSDLATLTQMQTELEQAQQRIAALEAENAELRKDAAYETDNASWAHLYMKRMETALHGMATFLIEQAHEADRESDRAYFRQLADSLRATARGEEPTGNPFTAKGV